MICTAKHACSATANNERRRGIIMVRRKEKSRQPKVKGNVKMYQQDRREILKFVPKLRKIKPGCK